MCKTNNISNVNGTVNVKAHSGKTNSMAKKVNSERNSNLRYILKYIEESSQVEKKGKGLTGRWVDGIACTKAQRCEKVEQ